MQGEGGTSSSCINDRDEKGCFPLMSGSTEGHLKVVELLLQWGSIVDLKDHVGSTALYEAVLQGHELVAEALLQHYDLKKFESNDRNKEIFFGCQSRVY